VNLALWVEVTPLDISPSAVRSGAGVLCVKSTKYRTIHLGILSHVEDWETENTSWGGGAYQMQEVCVVEMMFVCFG
jgi:hypothetical protein